MKSLVIAEKPSVARDIARVSPLLPEGERLSGGKGICSYLGAGTSCYFGRPGGI